MATKLNSSLINTTYIYLNINSKRLFNDNNNATMRKRTVITKLLVFHSFFFATTQRPRSPGSSSCTFFAAAADAPGREQRRLRRLFYPVLMNDEDEDDGEQHQTALSSSTLVDWSHKEDGHNDVVQPSWVMPTPNNEVRYSSVYCQCVWIKYDILYLTPYCLFYLCGE